MARILVTEPIAEGGLDRLRAAGHDVDVQLDPSPEELLELIKGAHALIIRSATTVTAEVLTAGTDLVVVGRAGIGLDNVDVDAATARGVMVVNAPQSNILSAAEHTMALLLAQARNVPQAHAALRQGRWERIALDRAWSCPTRRSGSSASAASASWWPSGRSPSACGSWPTTRSCPTERARQMSVELVDARHADGHGRLRHHPRGQDPRDGRAHRRRAAGPGQARHPDRQRGPRRHHRRGRAGRCHPLRATSAGRPSTCSPPSRPPSRRCSSSTRSWSRPTSAPAPARPRTRPATPSPSMVGLALAGEFVPFAVNVSAAEASETVRPFLPMAERLG